MSLNLANIFSQIVDRQSLAEAGATSVFIIKKRTQEGKFLPGSSAGSGSYSTKPFALPAGAVSSQAFNQLQNTDEGDAFFTKAGKLWFVMKNGYKRLRELEGLQSSRVDLKRRPGPGMLAALNVVKIDPNEQAVEVGFTDSESEQIAIWHQIMGAGKNKVKRIFVGHTDKEEKQIADATAKKIFANITRYNSAE
ncbi:MAG: hypothetical protein ABJI69_09175 [Balneola sp.]